MTEIVSEEQATSLAVGQAAEIVSGTLANADGEARHQIVDELNDQLQDAGVVVFDKGMHDETERKGVKTGRTREQVLFDTAYKGVMRSMRHARMSYSLGKHAVQ